MLHLTFRSRLVSFVILFITVNYHPSQDVFVTVIKKFPTETEVSLFSYRLHFHNKLFCSLWCRKIGCNDFCFHSLSLARRTVLCIVRTQNLNIRSLVLDIFQVIVLHSSSSQLDLFLFVPNDSHTYLGDMGRGCQFWTLRGAWGAPEARQRF